MAMSRALMFPHATIATAAIAIPRELAEELRTFAYALMGQGTLAEQIAIEVLANVIRQYGLVGSRMIALERVLLLSRFLSPQKGGFEQPADAPLRYLTLEQRAVVALRQFLRLPVEERLQILAVTEEEERSLWMTAMQGMIKGIAVNISSWTGG